MIEILINPRRDFFLDIREINQHSALVERFALENDDRFSVVSVQVPALAIVVQ